MVMMVVVEGTITVMVVIAVMGMKKIVVRMVMIKVV